ncbi:intein-containing Rv2578c family radical SAM protein [Microbacterium sp. CFH 31415]|uniref:intein-containing Rv2578c family radical SAM protein n=1 Tax=Microbacterium sp. CFH 31415 TaxID=2921732 RepID=UPI001F12F9CF|nr:intein-containing Rv2578c family radical SAM protein [Microbacterium sp. CFH 31415]MCH6230691.1 intein-containing Rv2578c family radical SAM protein [Microbacterium sp. CFH 31415]
MRWQGQELGVADAAALPGLEHLNSLVQSVTTPEFAGVTFHEVLCKTALNHVPGASAMPFDWTVNPYRGCSHACVYCLDPSTMILMADGRSKALRDVAVGDMVVGTNREGSYRHYAAATVTAKRSTRKAAYRVLLADGTELIASADHRFLTERGWKYVRPASGGSPQRPYLTTNNKLLGFGIGPMAIGHSESQEYRTGYLTGMIRGDAMMLEREYPRTNGRGTYIAHRFRLALADTEALDRSRRYLAVSGVKTNTRVFAEATANRRAMDAIFTSRAADYEAITSLVSWPQDPSPDWHRGFLAGVFDAEGSCSQGILRISNKDPQMIAAIHNALVAYDFDVAIEPIRPKGVTSVRLRGGLAERRRFFELVQPAITRKLALLGAAVKSDAPLRIVSIEDVGETIDMVDITTSTGDFIANGVVSHNCFARGTHEYLELDAGRDFDSQVIVKINVAEVLEKELRRGSWAHEPVMLGTNTDPYQRAEGRYKLMPGIVSALTESGTPFSILTKGTLLRRDLPLLREAAASVRVSIAMSIAIFDDSLQHLIEPGTPTAGARLETVRAATESGFHVTVFLMPIIPHLTDSIAAIDDALTRIRAAGATRVVYGALHLRPGAKQWFMQWLERQHPELVSSYLGLYPGASANAPKAYRTWLAKRVRPLLRVHGLDGRAEDDHPRGTPVSGLAARADARASGIVTTSRGRASAAAIAEPRLF